VQGSNLRPWD